jgi:hypothetical protein
MFGNGGDISFGMHVLVGADVENSSLFFFAIAKRPTPPIPPAEHAVCYVTGRRLTRPITLPKGKLGHSVNGSTKSSIFTLI